MKPHRRIVNQPVVLMVEDEPLVRLTQVDILREAEIWVVEAQDADEAFELLKRRPDIRAVLTDVRLSSVSDQVPATIGHFSTLTKQGGDYWGMLVPVGDGKYRFTFGREGVASADETQSALTAV